ncbi:CotS-related protein [Gracilibacillus boraciitolerans JCM 21714]|uniref:CotS-related protein n=1 Tax=Gracilibacillus boraciitolerans JCM 21714 TaxID=1298598 RepID=W4VIQ9_9BACI|nr:phosphotransferase [Gracilibacillus boraciitolerans]GAE92644.1 CotS-related protein [Gracilibacillus boraciitolerans JCM 21714]
MEWSDILTAYQIQSEEIEQITERVYKIKSNSRQFALKKSNLVTDDLGRWLAIYQYIQHKQIFGFVPVYQTKDRQPFYQQQTDIYYLMPWVERRYSEQPIDEYGSVVHAMGSLHASTMAQHEIASLRQNKSTLEQQFYQEIVSYREQMITSIRYFEAKRFMSPIELQICMYYRDMEEIFNNIEKWQEIYLEELENNDQMKYTLCHGNIKPSHYVLTPASTYFLNWEYAVMASPTFDLVRYYHYLFQFHDCDMDKVKESFSIYCQYINLTDYEKALLVLQILSPSNWLQTVLKCTQPTASNNNVRNSIEIEKQYRKLLFSFELQEYIFETLKREKVTET